MHKHIITHKHFPTRKFFFMVLIAFNLFLLISSPYKTMNPLTVSAQIQGSNLSNSNQPISKEKTERYDNDYSFHPINFSPSSSSSNTPSSYFPKFPSFNNVSSDVGNGDNNTNPTKPISVEKYDELKNCNPDTNKQPLSSLEYLTYFNCGHVKVDSSSEGKQQVTREFTLIIEENQSIPIADNGLKFNDTWTFNGTIPGPTMRVTEGDLVKINIINSMGNKYPHSLHLHSTHSGDMDGIDGPGGAIQPGQNYTYTFVAQPYGIYPYHCHVTPVEQHINKGLYGVFIIDPPVPRPYMNEMVMMMNGYDLDYEKEGIGPNRIPTSQEVIDDYMPQAFERSNEVYTVNGKAFDYVNHPIQLQEGAPYRIYLVNMLEFDPINNFHLHGNMFKYYPSGTSKTPAFVNDILGLTQGDRGILEFKYDLPGKYMFHSHINEFSDLGWMGFFDVI